MNFGLPTNGQDGLEPQRDTELSAALEALDPAQDDPNYWLRFRGSVLERATLELARRRMVARLTVQDVMSSWSKTLVPTALMAAAVAALTLFPGEEPALAEALTVDELEELLVAEIPAETQPVLLSPDAAAGIVAFASDEF